MSVKSIRQIVRGHNIRLLIASIAALVLWDPGSGQPKAASNPITVENALPGTLDSWDISGAGEPSIQGFATDISINTGQTVNFKIKTDSANYKIDIYRLGYYGGRGARNIATLGTFTQPQNQTATCATGATTGLVDCGNWAVSASWTATGAVSGIYIAKLTRFDGTGGSSHIVFIVRDDTRRSDVIVQTSDTTWQAYNQYGGASLYCGGPVSNAGTAYSCATRATKVSYNRPFDTRDHDARSFLFSAEYPMVRWLEANGYDVKYWAGVDTDRRGADLTNASFKPKTFLSMGHDEYWSGNQRTMVENARNAGVSLGFFSGNEMYWKTRYEPSIDGSNTAYRTLVTYKETLAGVKIDPAVDGTGQPIWTGTWRDPRFSPPADGGRPENGVSGNIWTVDSGTSAITVPAAMAGLRFWKNTRVAALTSGVATLSPESLGYEWDEDLDNGARPTGIMHLSSTTVSGVVKIIDYGATTATGTATHNLTLYRHASRALVFGAGTVQWSWGLDSNHDGGAPAAHVPDQAIQQSTVNVLADMGAQPATLQAGLTGTSASTDVFPPTSVVTPPAGPVQSGNRLTITGTATDTGGAVASVEVSVDGGATWHVAQGTATWSFDWQPGALGVVSIRSRAVDDSGNMETPGPGVTVSVAAGSCPCTSLWQPTVVPVAPNAGDPSAIEVGVKFKSDIDGFITGVRFYKGPTNTGTHQGSLWTLNGTRLTTAVFTTETPSGWQQLDFATPVHITANTTYIASYHTNVGGYSADGGYFANAGVDAWPLHALPSNSSGGNGVYSYGASVFPTHTFNSTNYWVDVVFAETIIDSTPLDISNISVAVIDGSTAVITWKTNRDANSRIDYSTNPAFPLSATLAKSDAAFVQQHSLTLTGLTPNATYYFRVTSVDHNDEAAVSSAPSFTVPGPTLHDTAAVDFLAGTRSNTYVSQTADGEVILAPTSGSEFTGPALPAGWIEVTWSPEGYSIIDNGVLLVDGARVATCVTDTAGVCVPGETATTTPSAIYTSPHSLEFSANFSGDQFQHAGLAQTLGSGSEPWAIFSTSGGGQLFTRTNTGSGSVDTPLGSGLVGSFHRYRIDWKAASVDYSVDGVLVHSDAATVVGPLRPVAASDFNAFGGIVFVDWMRMTPYAASGTFTSRVFDALASVDWHSLQWTAKTPAGTSMAISIRTGNTPTPDGTWSAFGPVTPGPITRTSRFVQYQATMTTSDPTQTPSLEDIIISTDHAPVAVNDAVATNLNTIRSFPASGPGSLTANDTDADGDVLRVTAVTQPAHGTAQLAADGSVTYTPAPSTVGFDDSFTYTISDGLMTGTATVSVSVGGGTHVNSAPVANNGTLTTNEDTAATGTLSASDADLNALTYSLVVNGTKGTATITNVATGAYSYAPSANANGTDTFTFKVNDGTSDSNVATVTVTINPVNDAPSFTKGANQSVLVNSGAQTAAGWATALSVGPANEVGQTLSFVVSNNNTALFSAQPAVASNGTLTYTSAVNAVGLATVTVAIKDNGGTANLGVDTSAPQTFTINVAPAMTATGVTSSNINSLFGVPITLTASVTAILPASGVVGGSVTFLDGTATIGTGVLSAGVATFTTSSLAVGTHTIKAVYTAGSVFQGSTSATISQVISPSATLKISFKAHRILDSSRNPKVGDVGVPNAWVGVYSEGDPCANGLKVSDKPKKWGLVVDGIDGPGGTDPGCPVVAVGSYKAVGTTDVNGNATIIVPPTKTNPNQDWIVIGRTTDFSYIGRVVSNVPLYAEHEISNILAGQTKNVSLDHLVPFAPLGIFSVFAANHTEEYGTYLDLLAPEDYEWTDDTAQYPFVLVADGTWDVTTSIAAPSGFVPDATSLATSVQDATSAVQFTLTDVGSDWTQTNVTHVINHKGTTRIRTNSIRMFNKKATKAKPDYTTVLPNSTGNAIDVLSNDNVAPPKTLTITAVTQGSNGSVTFTSTGVAYTPNPGFTGRDAFTYVIDDGNGGSDTGTVSVRVNVRPSLVLNDVTVPEGNSGTTTAAFTVTLSSAVDVPVVFDYTTVDNTAFAGIDYTLASGTLVIPAGSTSATITVQVIANTVFQGGGNRNFAVKLSNVVNKNAVIQGGIGKGVIVDDDPKPSISISPVSVVEGNSGQTQAIVTVTLSGSTALPATVDYKTVDGTATAGSDYAAVSGTLTFAPGDTTKTIIVLVNGDTTAETSETFSVRLSNATGATLAVNRADVTITDDDH